MKDLRLDDSVRADGAPPEAAPCTKLTHHELTVRAEAWLKRNGYTVTCREVVSYSTFGETPDAIGWSPSRGTSCLIECKVSRSDFLRDKKKLCRREWDNGMGQRRFFMCEPGIIQAEELPWGWGLLYCEPARVRNVVGFAPLPKSAAVALNEQPLLVSLVRRAIIRGFDTNCRDPKVNA